MRFFFICKDSELKLMLKKKKAYFFHIITRDRSGISGPEIKVLKFKRVFSLV